VEVPTVRYVEVPTVRYVEVPTVRYGYENYTFLEKHYRRIEKRKEKI
jgi:hypothetical protein